MTTEQFSSPAGLGIRWFSSPPPSRWLPISPPFALDAASAGSCSRSVVFLLTLAFAAQRARRWLSLQRAHGAAHPAVADRAGVSPAQPAAVAFAGLAAALLAHPLAGWLAGVGAMWFWHCAGALQRGRCLASGPCAANRFAARARELFWRQVLAPREEERLSPPGAVLYLFSACVTCSVLGIIITFSPVTVCSIYAMPAVTGSGCGRPFAPAGDSRRNGISRSAVCSCGCRCV